MEKKIKISLRPPLIKEYTLSRFEELFQLKYLPFLQFSDWRIEQWVKKKCAQAHKKGKISTLGIWLGKLHGRELAAGEIPEVSIRWISDEMGYGLFAERAFKQWEFIGEYTGVVRDRGLLFPKINDYCFMYPHEWFSLKALTIDSQTGGNYTRFINHSDTPNCESVAVLFEGVFHIVFRTIQEIPMGGQLTYDYGDIYWYKREKLKDVV